MIGVFDSGVGGLTVVKEIKNGCRIALLFILEIRPDVLGAIRVPTW